MVRGFRVSGFGVLEFRLSRFRVFWYGVLGFRVSGFTVLEFRLSRFKVFWYGASEFRISGFRFFLGFRPLRFKVSGMGF